MFFALQLSVYFSVNFNILKGSVKNDKNLSIYSPVVEVRNMPFENKL